MFATKNINFNPITLENGLKAEYLVIIFEFIKT